MEPTPTRPNTFVSIPDAVPAEKGLKLVGNNNKWFHEVVPAGPRMSGALSSRHFRHLRHQTGHGQAGVTID